MQLGVIALSLMLVGTVWAMELPAPPADFSWIEVPEIKAAFLQPRGWYVKREVQGNTLALFITQEKIENEGRFKTGLTINVLRHAKPGAAVEYAAAFIGRLATQHNAGDIWSREFGPLKGFGCRYKVGSTDDAPIAHTLMVANPRTGTLYLFLFEAPNATWADAWAKGEKIMNALAVDDEM
jgi:hypothetical protein